jgi:FtsP/CotA-like multicopper oxidase with cupredoxin domain
MPEETIVKDQAEEEDRNGSSNMTEESGFTRRDFLQQTIAVAGSLAVGSLLPSFASKTWLPAAQASKCIAAGQMLQSVMEIKSAGSGPTKTLKAVLKVLDEKDRFYWGQPDAGQTLPSCQHGPMRYVAGYDVNDPSKVWPKTLGVPSPAPTLRASVGDTVQITLLNQVDASNFPGTLDVVEKGVRNCDQDTTFGSGAGKNYPGKPTFENPPNCFHGSSSTNLHFHGTHVSPSGIADNVLINLRPSPRTPGPNSKPLVTEETVAPFFKKIFDKCATNSPWPLAWSEWPEDWQKFQQSLLEYYDNTATWAGQSPPPQPLWPLPPNNPKPVLPLHDQLWWNDQEQMTKPPQPQLPQYYVGAFPSCFTLPKWNGSDKSMGQAPGTHWYHAHKHGSTALNLANGMAGALIIEGDYDATLKSYYKDKGQPITEQVLVLQQISAVLGLLRPAGTKDLVWVNGQYTPVLEMKPNETQFWRFVNACHQAAVPLNSTAGLKWVQTAQDGVQLDPRNYDPDPNAETNKTIPVPAKAILQKDGTWLSTGSLAPGNRVDLLVQAPGAAGDYKVTFGDNTLLLTVRVKGTAVSAIQFPSRDEFPKMPGFLWDIVPPIGMVERNIHFNTTQTLLKSSSPTPTPQGSPSPTPTPPPGSTGGRNAADAAPPLMPNAPPTHTINGIQYSGEIDQFMKLGATEEWTLFNDSPKGGPAHPFHIHINPFQVIAMFDPAYMPASAAATGVPMRQPWVWWDNFAIPPQGWAKMWTRFVDFTGTYVFHCHILGHEDRGMMQMVNVSPSGTTMKHN